MDAGCVWRNVNVGIEISIRLCWANGNAQSIASEKSGGQILTFDLNSRAVLT